MDSKLKMITVMAIAIAGMSCQKLGEDRLTSDKLNTLDGNGHLSEGICYRTLPSVIEHSWTFDPDSVYIISGVTRITNGAVVTFLAGQVVLGDTENKGFLVVEPGSRLNALGTDCDPVIFSSLAPVSMRAAGDWGGLFILGRGDNNLPSKQIDLTIGGVNFTAGDLGPGVDNSDNSGILEYVQIHYAGFPPMSDTDPAALVLAGVGNATLIDHIQITNSATDGTVVRGGLFEAQRILSYDVVHTDFRITDGNQSNLRLLLAFKDNVTTTVTDGFALDVQNNAAGNTATPLTYPTISNATFIGGVFCEGDADYEVGIFVHQNGSMNFRNGVVTSFSDVGLFLNGDATVSNTSTGTHELQFAHSSFDGFTSTPYGFFASDTWFNVGGCALNNSENMTHWITGTSATACDELSNQLTVATLGYNVNSLCGNHCMNFPDFAIDEINTTLASPDYDGLNPTFFLEEDYRGALQGTSWITDCWADSCPQTTNYCV